MRAWTEFVREKFLEQNKVNVARLAGLEQVRKDIARLEGRHRHLLTMYTELKVKYQSLYFENEELFHNQKLLERIEKEKQQ